MYFVLQFQELNVRINKHQAQETIKDVKSVTACYIVMLVQAP